MYFYFRSNVTIIMFTRKPSHAVLIASISHRPTAMASMFLIHSVREKESASAAGHPGLARRAYSQMRSTDSTVSRQYSQFTSIIITTFSSICVGGEEGGV